MDTVELLKMCGNGVIVILFVLFVFWIFGKIEG